MRIIFEGSMNELAAPAENLRERRGTPFSVSVEKSPEGIMVFVRERYRSTRWVFGPYHFAEDK